MTPDIATATGPEVLRPPSGQGFEVGGAAVAGDREIVEIRAGDPVRVLVDRPPRIWITGTAVAGGRDSLVVAAAGDTVVCRRGEIVRVQYRYDPDGSLDAPRLAGMLVFTGIGAWAGYSLSDSFGDPNAGATVLLGMVGFAFSALVFGVPDDPHDPRWEDVEGLRVVPVAGARGGSGVGLAWRF